MSTTDFPSLVAARIARARIQKGWSGRELASRAGLSGTSVVWRAEHATGEIFLSTAARIARALGLSLDELAAEASCRVCDDAPPAGFRCLGCGKAARS